MGKLLKKEWMLFAHPMNYLFLTFIFMLFIPSYPYYVMTFYVLLGIFFAFISGRENKDLQYMAILPIKKEEIVKGKYGFVYSVELLLTVLTVPVIVLRSSIITYENQAGIEANVAFLGFNFILMAIFNWIFLGSYFKRTEKIGVAFLKAGVGTWVFILLAEGSIFAFRAAVGSCFYDSTEPSDLIKQVPILLVGMVVYFLFAYIRYRKDVAHFLKQDL